MTELVVDWCSYEAAKYAVMHWHYSRTMPAGKLVKVGAWEDGVYIGCVLFGRGANNHIGSPYGLGQTEVCELVRIALTKHETPVSRIATASIKMLKAQSPQLRLIVSYADPEQEHVGTIYQAGNWIYAGRSQAAEEYIVNGKRRHGRSFSALKPAHLTTKQALERMDPNHQVVMGSSKHRYLYPLDRAMRRQILPLAQPYPKQAEEVSTVTR